MPQGYGGFDVSQGMGQAANLLQLIEALKARRLAKENPLPHALETVQGFQGKMGEGYDINDPRNAGTLGQMERLLQLDPQQAQGLRETLARTPSPARQRRVLDLQRELGLMTSTMAKQREMNNFSLNFAKQQGADPEIIKMFENQARISDQEIMQAHRRSMELGYQDIMSMPEVQQMFKQAMIEGVMGPSSPGGGFMPPGIGGGAPPGMPPTPEGGPSPTVGPFTPRMGTAPPPPGGPQMGGGMPAGANPQSQYWQQLMQIMEMMKRQRQ